MLCKLKKKQIQENIIQAKIRLWWEFSSIYAFSFTQFYVLDGLPWNIKDLFANI